MDPDLLQQVLDYHQATKHDFHGYARGSGYMDWATQPNPFRRYDGTRLIPLEKIQLTDEPLYDDAFIQCRIAPLPLNLLGKCSTWNRKRWHQKYRHRVLL